MMADCPGCSTPLNPEDRVCSHCGLKVSGTTTSFEPVALDGSPAEKVTTSDEGPLLVVRKGPQPGERFFLDRPRLVIGRDPESDIFLNDMTVSRSHAVVESDSRGVRVSDAGSLNGTYVNGVVAEKASLNDGDVLQIGTFQMLFLSGA
jgi:pSer/pThr/pTyr-binding forkhead associated (FHA) protein